MEERSPEGDEVRSLQLEILRLQTKLSDFHASDSAADRRALATLHQHIDALQTECQVPLQHPTYQVVTKLGQQSAHL